MRKRFFLKASLAVAMMVSAPLFAHAQDSLAKVKAAGTLKVGTETAFAPFDFIDEAGEHSGLNVDVFNEIGKELGVKIEWVELPWDGVFPALEAGQFQMVAGPATITKARVERYRFLSPVAEATVAILKSAKDDTITKPEDIAGKTIGAGKASAQLAQLQAYGKTLPQPVTAREYPGNNEAYADLAAGRIAGVANSLPNITYVASKQPEIFAVVTPAFGQKSYFGYIGTKKPEDQALLDEVQAALVKIKADGRLKTIQEKWFGASFDTPELPPEPKF